MATIFTALIAICLAVALTVAHPGHSVAREAAERRDFLKHEPRTIRSCTSELARLGHTSTAVARRQQFAKSVKAKRSLSGDKHHVRRDWSQYNVSHASSDVSFGAEAAALFADNSSCILQGEVTQGPYYVDGELIRNELQEGQEGVPLFLDVQIIDTSTCMPLPAVYIDLWHCNATGVYSGVIGPGNGNTNDTANINNTFLRGIQSTDMNGVVQVETIFPGHYIGRTNHIHILTHNTASAVVRTNRTLLDATGNFTTHASHVGQLFFDQSLVSLVEATYPYNTNTVVLTTNAEDIFLDQEAETTDPFVHYTQLTDDIADGILAWISVGIDPTSDQKISSAATFYDSGGESNPNLQILESSSNTEKLLPAEQVVMGVA